MAGEVPFGLACGAAAPRVPRNATPSCHAQKSAHRNPSKPRHGVCRRRLSDWVAEDLIQKTDEAEKN